MGVMAVDERQIDTIIKVRGRGFSFVMVPASLLKDRRVSDSAKILHAYLRYIIKNEGDSSPPRNRIAKDLGRHPRTISRLLLELEREGWIEREIRDGDTSVIRVFADRQD